MGPVKSIYQSMIPNLEEHPERLNATLERVQEVANIILEGKTLNLRQVLKDAKKPVQHPREPLRPKQAIIIANSLAQLATWSQIQNMIQLINYSEISKAEAIDLHETYKIPVSKLEKDIIPIKGEGCWILDIEGKTYLDMDSNYSATNLGMSNEDIAKGLYNQACQLISMKEDRVHIPRSRFLKSFIGMLPEEIAYFYWQNSGGEAVDKSLKIAKAYTGQTGVVAFKGGFHGRTHGAIAVTYNIKYRKPFGLDSLDWVHFVDYNDASTVEELFVSGKSKIVILELIQGEEAGIRPAHPDFVKKLRQICDRYDGVLICDEVQTGFGRVAEKEGQWFACQNYDIVPDIIIIGKSFGGGYPVTAVVTNEKISHAMVPGYDGSTFGGNPMAMVSAMIATRQMQNLNLTKNVIDRSSQIKEGLYKLREKYSLIGDIRIKGLFIGFDLPSVEHTWKFQQLLARHSIKSSLTTDKTIRFLPPLVISKEDIDFLLNKIDLALDDLEKYDQDN